VTHHLSIRRFTMKIRLAGIVYKTRSYLRYIERPRSDWGARIGNDQLAMKAEGVRSCCATGRRRTISSPASLMTSDVVDGGPTSITPARMVMQARKSNAAMWSCFGRGSRSL